MTQSRAWLKLTFGTEGEKRLTLSFIHSFIQETLSAFTKKLKQKPFRKEELKHFRGTIYTGFTHVKYSFTKTGCDIALQTVKVIET